MGQEMSRKDDDESAWKIFVMVICKREDKKITLFRRSVSLQVFSWNDTRGKL